MSEKPIKVLLIESDPIDARLVRKYLLELASVPSTLNWVKSLAEGIDALSRDAYSILLLDLNLPDSRGLATVKGIMDCNPKIPVLVLTGYDEKYLAIQTLHEGAEDYIVKNDLTNHHLINSIRNVIERYSIRQELREKNEELENICKNFFNLVGMQADGVVVVDARGIIRYMNPVAMDLLDFQFDPLADTPFTYGVKEDRVLDVEIYRKRKPPCLIEMRQSNFIWEGKPAHLISIHDVTDQRRAEDLLRRNQAMLLEAQNIAHIGSWEHDIATGREIWSNEMFQIFKIECPSGDIAPLDWYRSIHPDDWKKIENGMQNAIKNKVPLNLEFRIIHPDGTTHWGDMIGKILNDEEGRVIKVYGTVQDITERKLVAKSLKQERDRAQHYLDVAGVMLLALDNNGIITLINKKGCEILGYGEEAILGKVWFDDFLPQDLRSKVKINFQKFFTEGIKKFKEQTPIPVLCKGGELKYITFRNSLVRDKGGNIIGILSSGDDITERKRAQESLQQSEEKYRTLVEQLNDIICSSDTEGVVTFISPVVEAITGFAPKQLLNRKMCDFYIEEDRPRFMDNFKRVLAGETFSAEYRILHKSGNLMWIRTSARPLFKGNMLIGTQGIVTDITSQKLAEQALRESEAQLKDAQALGQIGSWEYDYKTRKVKWSDQTYRLLDRDPSLGPFTAEEEAKCYTADLFQKVKDYRRRAVEEGKSYKYDVEMVFPIDKHLFLAAILQPIKDADGRVVKLFGTLQDITERKRVQESLQQSEETYRTLVEQLNVVIYTTDTEGVVTFVSPIVEAITGFAPMKILKRKVFDFCIEEDRPILRDNFNRVLAGERVTEEYRIIHKSGSLIWLQANSRPLYRGNTLIGIQGVETDITSKKLAEQALRESEAHLKHAQTLGEIGSWEFDIKTKKANWSDQLYRLFDRDPSLGPFSAEEEKYVYLRGYLERENEYRHRAFAEGKVFKYDSEMILPSGRHVFLLSMVASLKDAQGKVTMLFGAVQDITERKLAEQDLKFRNVLLSTQQETSIDGILVVNEKGNILSWNQRFVSMWDISADTIATPTDNLIIKSVIGKFVNPERYFEKMKYLYAHQYETSQDEIALKNGRNFEIYSAPMLGADTKYYGRVWYFRDITERKRAETALRESEQKFRNFIEQSAEALFLTDEQGKICLWNSSSEHIFGVKSAIAIGKNLWDVQFEFVSKANKNSQYYNSLKDNIVNVLNTGHGDWVNKLMEREIYLPTGKSTIIETIAFTIQSEKGFLLGSVIRNVMEHK